MKKIFAIFFMMILLIPLTSFAENENMNQFHQGTIQWVEMCVVEGSTATIRVTDADMNISSASLQSFDIKVWSDSDRLEKNHTVTETGINTGVFESVIFFKTLDDSSGHRIRAFDGDVVYAKYVDQTMPSLKLEKEKITTFTMSDLRVIDWLNHKPSKLLYDPCTITYMQKNSNSSNHIEIFYPAPLKQIKSGVQINEVKCKENLTLSYRHDVSIVSDTSVVTFSPVCLTDDSRQKLLERGWLKYFPVISDVVKKRTFSMEIDGEFSSVSYNVKNANISKVIFGEGNNPSSLLTYVQVLYSDASLEVTIPRNVIDSKMIHCNDGHGDADSDEMFFILINGEEVSYSETETAKMYRTIHIPLKDDSSTIEIIGTCPT